MPPIAAAMEMEEAISDPTAKRRRRRKIYGFRTFMDPGCPTSFFGAFRDNARRFVRECADVEEAATAGMATWCTLLVDEKSGAVVPLYTVEECVPQSAKPFCDYCRCSGWSHHFVSKRRYHIIIPADDVWNKPLHPNAFNLATHLLHGLIHCNGFGHLLLINGHEGGSKFISGSVLMDLWDRLCTSLRVREVRLEDVSKKYSLDLRLLYGMAYGIPWFARWNYRFLSGSFGLTESSYSEAIDRLSFLPLDSLLADLNSNNTVELRDIVSTYRILHPLKTIRDLLHSLLDLKHQNRQPPPRTKNPQPPKKTKRPMAENAKKKPRDFASVAAGLDSRWPVRRLITAAQVVVDALSDHGSKMTRQEIRDAARLTLGDTGLLDFVLKSMGDTIVNGHVVRRKSNPINRVLEFSLGKIQDTRETETGADMECTILSCATRQVEKDLQIVYNCILAVRAQETRAVLDAKHWGKTFDLHDEADDYLRIYIQWMPSETEMEWLTGTLPPPELVVLDAFASIEDLKAEAERAVTDTYCIMEGFRVIEMEGIEGEDWAPVMLAGFQSGATIWMRGVLLEVKDYRLKYEGGEDRWAVGCGCGAREDDGERMVACDACDVWHHTRCIGIDDSDPVPLLFLCLRCGSLILAAAAAEEEEVMRMGFLA